MTVALQAALGALNEAVRHRPDQAVAAATARGLLFGYDRRWGGADWRTVCVEEEYHLPVVNPDTGRPSRSFTHAGKLDAVAEFAGRHYLVEHKTCGEDIADPHAPYWRRLDIDAQVSGYVLARWQGGVKLDGTLYDVVRKPSIRPRQVSRADKRLESPDAFEDRLIIDTLERPDFYFQRKVVPRLDGQLLEFARELWETADEIRLARLRGRHYRNSGACMQWGRPCAYLGLCAGHDTPEGGGWAKKPRVHGELATIDGDGRSVLTHSRMSTFKTCKRKHYYRYELGLERAGREEAEALYFGSLLHLALAAWWGAKKPVPEKVEV